MYTWFYHRVETFLLPPDCNQVSMQLSDRSPLNVEWQSSVKNMWKDVIKSITLFGYKGMKLIKILKCLCQLHIEQPKSYAKKTWQWKSLCTAWCLIQYTWLLSFIYINSILYSNTLPRFGKKVQTSKYFLNHCHTHSNVIKKTKTI